MLNRCWNIALFVLLLAATYPAPLGSESLKAAPKRSLLFSDTPQSQLLGYRNMVRIQQGNFRMGSSFQQTLEYYNRCKKLDKRCKVWWFRDERPERNVFLDTYWIDRYEVTNEKYLEFALATGHRPALDDSCESETCKEGNLWDGYSFPNKIKNQPVIQVSWYDADSYCRWRDKRLPTEAEWEKAARGTEGFLYPWGNSPPTPAHTNYNRKWKGYATLSDVGKHPPGISIYGVYDMTGNVWEWVADWYDLTYYPRARKKNPKGPKEGQNKLVRGGSWVNNDDVLHSAFRRWSRPEVRFNDTGFRCAKDDIHETQAN